MTISFNNTKDIFSPVLWRIINEEKVLFKKNQYYFKKKKIKCDKLLMDDRCFHNNIRVKQILKLKATSPTFRARLRDERINKMTFIYREEIPSLLIGL